MHRVETAIFLARLELLPDMLLWVRSRFAKGNIPTSLAHRLEVAVEEALMNVIRHSYTKDTGNIEMGLEISNKDIAITVRDWGSSYDFIANAPKVDLNAPLEEREPGGLGIYLMRQIMDQVTYQRQNDTNLLTLIKKLS